MFKVEWPGFRSQKTTRLILYILRVAIGWHFFYEGIAKLFIPGWSAGPFLESANGIFGSFFHWMASSPATLTFINAANIWLLIIIGTGLIIGMLTRVAAIAGALLLLFYYAAHPPFFVNDFRVPLEGHYLFVNKNLVELFALLLIAVQPGHRHIGLDRLIGILRNRRHSTNNDTTAPVRVTERREIIKNLATLLVFAPFGWGVMRKQKWEKAHAITGASIHIQESNLRELKGELPQGVLGGIKMSRLILGNNLIGGWSHSRDLIYVSSLFKAYNTDRKVMETLALAERAGINMMNLVNAQFPLLRMYAEVMGGKMQTMVQTFPTEADPHGDIDLAIANGATTVYIQGGVADGLVKDGKIDLLAKCIEYIRSHGMAAGLGAHSIEVPLRCAQAGVIPDYYVKTHHHDKYWSATPRANRVEFSVDRTSSNEHDQFHDNMFDLFPEKTIEFMRVTQKPWVAFKVLAGGAIPPEDGFRYAFKNGADFICVGMFDFQILNDVNIAIEAITEAQKRERPWMA